MSILHMAHGVIVNLFVLLGFVALCAMLRSWALTRQRSVPAWQRGILFGGMAIVAMLVPTTTGPGLIFDCRSSVMGTAGLLYGPLTALIAIPSGCAYRLYVGGVGVVPGIFEIILPALLGSLFHLWLRWRKQGLTMRRILAASLLVGVGSNSLIMLFIDIFRPETALQLKPGASALVLLNTFVSMSVLSALIVLEKKHSEAIDALAESERRMLHSQKMAAVGELARKIAHNFMNTLTVIVGNAQLAKENASDAPQVKELTDGIIAAAGHVSGLVAELLAFANPGSLRLRVIDLSNCVVGIKRILSETIGPEIEVILQADANVGNVRVDPDLIEQAILHVAVNAAEAMPGRGCLTISVTRAKLSQRETQRLQAGIPEANQHHGPFALLSIEDTGCGMPPDVIPRIFEPFYTTKPKAEKAGLGLASVYAIIKQHDGVIDVNSHLGRGTTFLIYLPIVS